MKPPSPAEKKAHPAQAAALAVLYKELQIRSDEDVEDWEARCARQLLPLRGKINREGLRTLIIFCMGEAYDLGYSDA